MNKEFFYMTHVLNSNDFYGKHMYENCKETKGMK